MSSCQRAAPIRTLNKVLENQEFCCWSGGSDGLEPVSLTLDWTTPLGKDLRLLFMDLKLWLVRCTQRSDPVGFSCSARRSCCCSAAYNPTSNFSRGGFEMNTASTFFLLLFFCPNFKLDFSPCLTKSTVFLKLSWFSLKSLHKGDEVHRDQIKIWTSL